MYHRVIAQSAVIIALGCLSTMAFGQTINVTNGSAIANINPINDQGEGAANYQPTVRAPSYMSQNWWWYRIHGVNDREYALPGGGTIYNDNTNNVLYAVRDVENGAFNAGINYSMKSFGIGSHKTILFQAITIENTSNQTMSLSLYNFVDLDPNSSNNNTAAWDPRFSYQMRISDVDSGKFSDYSGYDRQNASYRVEANPALLNALIDQNPDEFHDSGMPFAAGDWTGGYEWTATLGPGSRFIAYAQVSTNRHIPAPGTLTLLAMGGLVGGHRRRRR